MADSSLFKIVEIPSKAKQKDERFMFSVQTYSKKMVTENVTFQNGPVCVFRLGFQVKQSQS